MGIREKIFVPNFVEFENYIISVSQVCDDLIESIRCLECQDGSTAKSVEWVFNHLSLADIQRGGWGDVSGDTLIFIGERLKSVYEETLKEKFPGKPCIVKFYQPDNTADISKFQLTFWQEKHERHEK